MILYNTRVEKNRRVNKKLDSIKKKLYGFLYKNIL